ncbi:MAG: TonB-dependent receptor [Ignavibacteriaceae bacterium]|nr:TonB-dependent receptor [Ignavibacteriaceae bacterium]
MKILIILFLFCTIAAVTLAQVSGKVYNAETQLPLSNANVTIANKNIGTISGKTGEFTLHGYIIEGDVIVISFVGYTTKKIVISQKELNNPISISLEPAIIPAQTVFVEATVGEKGVTPLTFQQISKDNIEKNYIVQDIPQFLGDLPSTTFYSENGNGIGYNYLSIRGFDQRRISVSINGIPQNDPEDHDVYWLDFPDLLESTEFIQVQRGAGSGIIGYPAVGGSINIITSNFSSKPDYNFSSSIGSYNTRKYLASYSSGLIDNKYSFYTKISEILSSGYRNLSWTDFKSYYLSAVRYDDNLTSQVNIYGGPVADGLAYTGLPKFAIQDKYLRRQNYSYWTATPDSFTSITPRRPEEIENFSQPHYELLNEYKISDDVTLNSALFYVNGSGFFNYDGSWADTTYFRLTRQNGFAPSGNPGNALIGAWVDNKQGGWIPRLSWKHTNGEFIAGAEFRIHRSEHWGNISYAENLPAGVTSGYQYYDYRGGKDMVSGYIHESYQVNSQINLLGELQIAYHKYLLYQEKYVGTDFSVKNTFVNPRFGINYKYFDDDNLYFSFANISREPRLSNYYNADESSGGEVPQFKHNLDGSYNFSEPLVNPETMNDLEFGASFLYKNLLLTINLYYMLFDNEIVENGQVDQYGVPVTGNVKSSTHKGLELSALYKKDTFNAFVNVSMSQNFIKEGRYYIDSLRSINLSGNEISGFPGFLFNFGVSYETNKLYMRLTGKYVGAMYSDNYDKNLNSYLVTFGDFVSYTDNKNPAYFTADFLASYSFILFNALTDSKIYFQVNNIFDRLYSANAIGAEYFPGAERNFIAGFKLGL